MKLRTLLWLSAVSFGLFAGVSVLSARLAVPIPEQAVAGKQVWQRYNCISCHTLFGNGGYAGDDLTHITDHKDPSQVVHYLIQAPVMRPHQFRHHPALNEAEADELVQYLEFVSKIPTLGWPPERKRAENSS